MIESGNPESEPVETMPRAALEASVIDGYRAGRYGSATVRSLLNHLTRAESDQWLAARGVGLNYSLEDLEADRKVLDSIFRKRE